MDDKRSTELDRLGNELNRAQAEVDRRNAPRKRQPTAMGLAVRIVSDLVAALVVGVAIGWVLDRWLETKPLFLLIFFVLGTAAGVMNVYRVTKPKPDEAADVSKLPRVADDGDD